jgi:hypothetical protein
MCIGLSFPRTSTSFYKFAPEREETSLQYADCWCPRRCKKIRQLRLVLKSGPLEFENRLANHVRATACCEAPYENVWFTLAGPQSLYDFLELCFFAIFRTYCTSLVPVYVSVCLKLCVWKMYKKAEIIYFHRQNFALWWKPPTRHKLSLGQPWDYSVLVFSFLQDSNYRKSRVLFP